MDTECPYCSMKSLVPVAGPDDVFFTDHLIEDGDEFILDLESSLNMVDWRAFKCDTCMRVCILDVGSV